MSNRFLAWYACGALTLVSSLTLFICVVPGGESALAVLQAEFALGALTLAAVGIALGRLPPGHWGNRSLIARSCLAVVAVAATLLVVMIL